MRRLETFLMDSPSDSALTDHANHEVALQSPAPREVERAEYRPLSRWWLPMAATMALLLASFFFVEPALRMLQQEPARPVRRLPGLEQPWQLVAQQRVIGAITAAWFFMLGASLGSFLHCVEYRVPRGVSIVARGSACPGCGTPIRLWHNVPVFGWLWLRGRCAKCGWEIPARYALTELAFGLVFVLLMGVELVGGGLNLPLQAMRYPIGTENIWEPQWRLIGVFAYHAVLLTLLLTCCLFAADRFRLPWPLLAIALTLGIAGPLLWPPLQVVGWDGLTNTPAFPGRLRAAIGLAIGAIAGLLLGYCLVRRTPGNIRASDTPLTLLALLLVGLYLGWQAAVAVAALTVIIRFLLAFTPAKSWPAIAAITLATTLHLLAWRWLAAWSLYPGLHSSTATIGVALFVAVGALLLDQIEHGGDAGPTIVPADSPPEPTDIAASAPIDVFPLSAAEPENVQIEAVQAAADGATNKPSET